MIMLAWVVGRRQRGAAAWLYFRMRRPYSTLPLAVGSVPTGVQAALDVLTSLRPALHSRPSTASAAEHG